MKTLKLIVLSTLVAAFASSCSKAPKACFSVAVSNEKGDFVNSNTGKVGESFYFSPLCSKKVHSLSTVFEYGDGTTAGSESHVYTKPGTYTVKCTVYGASNGGKSDQSDVFTQSVVVTSPQAQASKPAAQGNLN